MDRSPPGLLCPWDFPGKKNGLGCHFLLQGTFLSQGLNHHLLTSPALAGGFFTASTAWEAHNSYIAILVLLNSSGKGLFKMVSKVNTTTILE